MEGRKKTTNLRETMPRAAAWVDAQRRALGADHVNACIKRAMAGEPGQFYVVERVAPDTFKTLGTPSGLETPAQFELIGRCFVGFGVDLYPFIVEPGAVDKTGGA